MKRFFCMTAIILFTMATISCSLIDKIKQQATPGNLKKIADLADMDFGDGPSGPFKVENTKNKDSTVVIVNNTDRTITVKATGEKAKKTFVVATQKSQSGIVVPGTYLFKATAEGVKGCEGKVALKRFKQYKWTFIIKKK